MGSALVLKHVFEEVNGRGSIEIDMELERVDLY
jgi:hypothetical protein